MSRKSKRDIEFAVDTAIEVLRGVIASNRQSAFYSDQGVLQVDLQTVRIHSPQKHGKDLERAIAILKAIKAGICEG